MREEKLKQIDHHLQDAIDAARQAGIPLKELILALETLYEGE
jgi:DNA-binding transcriptional regulator YhcF (GntR family)